MIHPTTYLSPEECAAGEGLRIFYDQHFYWPQPVDPLSPGELEAIDAALQIRCHTVIRKQGHLLTFPLFNVTTILK